MSKNYHKTVERTVTVTHCHGQYLVNGEFYDFSADLDGDYTLARAQARLRRDFEDLTITINNIEKETARYRMPLYQFINQAEKTPL